MAFALLSTVGACAPVQARKAAGARRPAPRCRWGFNCICAFCDKYLQICNARPRFKSGLSLKVVSLTAIN